MFRMQTKKQRQQQASAAVASSSSPAASSTVTSSTASAVPSQRVIVPSVDMLSGNKKSHAIEDYLWLVITLLAIGAIIIFWPVWDILIDSEEDSFSVLGVSQDANKGLIKQAYRGLARQWHPDLNPGCGETCRQRMRFIQKAYDQVMRNPQENDGHQREEGNGLVSILQHLFLWRFVEMAVCFVEFFIQVALSFNFSKILAVKCWLDLAAAVGMYFYLVQKQLPLSVIGIIFSLLHLRKLQNAAASQPRSPHPPQEFFNYFLFVTIPTNVVFICLSYGTFRFDGFFYPFSLSLLAGNVYLAGFLVRTPPQIFQTFQIKRVRYLSFRMLMSLVWEVVCADLVCYFIRVPPPFRIAVHLLILLFLYQRWIYIHVGKNRLNEFGQVIGIEGSDVMIYPGFNPAAQNKSAEESRNSSTTHPVPQLTESTKLSLEDRIKRQRQSPEERAAAAGNNHANGPLKLILLVILAFVVVLGVVLGPHILRWTQPEDPTDTVVSPSSASNPRHAHSEEIRAEFQREKERLENEKAQQRRQNSKSSSKAKNKRKD